MTLETIRPNSIDEKEKRKPWKKDVGKIELNERVLRLKRNKDKQMEGQIDGQIDRQIEKGNGEVKTGECEIIDKFFSFGSSR